MPKGDEQSETHAAALTTVLELTCAALVSLTLFGVWSDPSALALLPWAAVAGLMAWSRR